ncbi:MAG TPA: DUF4271 domain-containing protein [Chitinophagaceae bacterium]|nr:DUF4271 domain-containing protein [Chitinophagaceae bacterium]
MNKLFLLLLYFSFICFDSSAQDSASSAVKSDFVTEFVKQLSTHPYYNFFGKAEVRSEIKRTVESNDLMFYVLIGLLFYFALIKTLFSKYVDNLIAIFLRITLKQQQLREQLLQAPLPSLMLNVLFLLSGGFYASLLLEYYKSSFIDNFWLQTAYCVLLLAIIYLGKFIVLKSAGWIFKITRATDTYIFIVFLVNKMLGIILLPFIVLYVFQPPIVRQVLVTLSLMFIIFLFAYRFIFSFRPLKSEIKMNLLHFFIYLCAFEIAPLLLIYKVLLTIVERSN